MTDPIGPEEFSDVNEAVGKDWEAETTPYERAREVISRAYTPLSADTVAEDARTSPKTARKHLNASLTKGSSSQAPAKTEGNTTGGRRSRL